MRTLLTAAALLVAAPIALAQTPAERPKSPPPAASAPFEIREDWCEAYATWFVERVPMDGELPKDVRPTQRIESEMRSCKIDPQRYQRDTLAEIEMLAPRRS